MSASDVFGVILILIGITTFFVIVFSEACKFSINVSPHEWVVISNTRGEIDALEKGVHSLSPDWKELDRVPITIRQLSKTEVHFVTSNSIRMVFNVWSSFVVGHSMSIIPETENWFEVDQKTVDKKMVIRASSSASFRISTGATALDDHVRLALRVACGMILCNYTDEELLGISDAKPLAPKTYVAGIKPICVESAPELHAILSEYIRRVANQDLEKTGVGLINVSITSPRYQDPKLQNLIESGRYRLLILDAVNLVETRLPGSLDGLSIQEKMCLGEPEFAAAAIAQTKVDIAKAVSVANVAVMKAASEASVAVTEALTGGITEIVKSSTRIIGQQKE